MNVESANPPRDTAQIDEEVDEEAQPSQKTGTGGVRLLEPRRSASSAVFPSGSTA